jgi:acyl-CoA synthetase (NDP forming)
VVEAVLKQAGLVAARDLEEVVDLLVGFTSPVLPQGKRLGLLVEAGGGAVAASDAAAMLGFELPALSAITQRHLTDILKDVIPPFASPRNPVDIVWGPSSGRTRLFEQCARAILGEVDSLLIVNYGPHDEEFARVISGLRDETAKPILVAPAHSSLSREGMGLLTVRGIPSFTTPERALRTLAAMLEYSRRRREAG